MAWLREMKRKSRETGRMSKYYVIGWRDAQGKVRERALGFMNAPEARKALKVFEGKLASGELLVPVDTVDVPRPSPGSFSTPTPATAGPRRRKFAEFIDGSFLPRVKRDHAPKTYETTGHRAQRVKERLGDLFLDEITFAVIDDYIGERSDEVRSRTIQLELKVIRQALQLAVNREELAALPKIPTLKLHDAKPHRFLTDDESKRILAAMDPRQPNPPLGFRPTRERWAWLAVLMALTTGMRVGELLSRSWADICWDDVPNGSILVAEQPKLGFKVKTRSSRIVPMTRDLRRALLQARTWTDSPWIFPSIKDPSVPRQQFRHSLENACDRAGVPRIHVHGLRHTWASRMARRGMDRRALMDIGGWTTSQMLDEVYSHVNDEHKAAVMDRMALLDDPSDDELNLDEHD